MSAATLVLVANISVRLESIASVDRPETEGKSIMVSTVSWPCVVTGLEVALVTAGVTLSAEGEIIIL